MGGRMKILVFLQGTTLMHRDAVDVPWEDQERQVEQGTDDSVGDSESYIPVGKAVEKLMKWRNQGAEILYLGSHRDPNDVEKDRLVLAKYGFPPGPVLYRSIESESYASIAEKVLPDLIVEDDCLSIGGEPEMTYPNMSDDAKRMVKSIVVREHGGIDHLPDDLSMLRNWRVNRP